MKRTLLLAVATLFSMTIMAQNSTLSQTVKGTVVDDQSGGVLSNATVILEATGDAKAVVSDSSGIFKLRNVPLGRQTIRVTLIGYEEAVIRNIEVTSSKEVVLEIRVREKIKKLDEVILKGGKGKGRALNESAVVSARQFSMDEAVRYAGTRNDPSRMAQNFA
ncbi:MAG: carboxypeptidase-like regulatory domain-containing protein, partial [Chitinophagaceae bacterium]|nr:carboxypeptidase-like regulatory domain-containing protein [Chitinophagaceae bacterium]